MNASNYSSMSSASHNPREFVLKALKKIQLNNKNVMKFLEIDNFNAINERLFNSIHLLEELDSMLNREVYNPTVELVSNNYQLLLSAFEEIAENITEGKINKIEITKMINHTDIYLNNLYEGFNGMEDNFESENIGGQ